MSLVVVPISKPIEPIVPVYVDLTSTSTIRSYIGTEAEKKGISPELAQGIAYAESHFVYNAKNPSSTASGVYEFLDGTFKHYCINMYGLTETMKDKNDVKIQVECALLMIATDPKGIHHWDASITSWGKYIPASAG